MDVMLWIVIGLAGGLTVAARAPQTWRPTAILATPSYSPAPTAQPSSSRRGASPERRSLTATQ